MERNYCSNRSTPKNHLQQRVVAAPAPTNQFQIQYQKIAYPIVLCECTVWWQGRYAQGLRYAVQILGRGGPTIDSWVIWLKKLHSIQHIYLFKNIIRSISKRILKSYSLALYIVTWRVILNITSSYIIITLGSKIRFQYLGQDVDFCFTGLEGRETIQDVATYRDRFQRTFRERFSTRNSKFIIRIVFMVYLGDDLISQNRLSNLILPLELK